jgi:hypothetical protein
MRLWGLIAICMLAAAACVHAPENWGTPWDKFIGQKDVKVTLTKDKAGNEVRTIDLPSGVSATQTRKPDGQIETMAMDDSGLGAVMCFYQILTVLMTTAEVCPNVVPQDMKRFMWSTFEKYNHFISSNSLEEVTLDVLQERFDHSFMEKKSRFSLSSLKDQKMACTSGDAVKMLRIFAEEYRKNPKKLEDGVQKHLSVPRPPVTNVCL